MQKKVYKVDYKERVLEFDFDLAKVTDEWKRLGVLELEYKHVIEAEQRHQELLDIAKKLGWFS